MAGRNKQPVDVLTARGKSHLTKAEKERRKATESVVPVALRGVSPPGYLDKWPEIRDEFNRYAEMMTALMPDNFGQPDADCLARYVVSESLYERYTSDLMEERDPLNIKNLQIAQDRAFKQAQACASSLGLTVTARCKLVVPERREDDGEGEF